MICRVYADRITELWPQVAPLLKHALDLTGTHDLEDVRKVLLTGTAHLWIQWTDSVDAALVTEFVFFPKGLYLRIWLAGARKGADVDWRQLADLTKAWGKSQGCIKARIEGRKGWLRLLPEARLVSYSMECDL